jgi:hypothetical protein
MVTDELKVPDPVKRTDPKLKSATFVSIRGFRTVTVAVAGWVVWAAAGPDGTAIAKVAIANNPILGIANIRNRLLDTLKVRTGPIGQNWLRAS